MRKEMMAARKLAPLVLFLATTEAFLSPSRSSPISTVRFQQKNRSHDAVVSVLVRLNDRRRSMLVTRKMVSRGRSDRDGSHDSYEYDEDDEMEIDLSGQDWRAFRAKLVMNEPHDDDEDDRPIPSGANNIFTQYENDITSGVNTYDEEEICDATTGECDVDGLGSLYGFKPGSIVYGEKDKMSGASARKPTPPPYPQPQMESMGQQQPRRTPVDPSHWAYDSGNVIEKGAVILGGVEQEYGFGLRQQYFHKAAILVLDHDEHTFTKGIILNRPTDLYLEDDLNHQKWRVWYGGDVQGLHTDNPDIVCLHSLTNKAVSDASVPVMKDIQWTTFENAKRLVHAGYASPSDFWVFCGYAGWGPTQLMGELDRKSWYMVATDSNTLLQQLKKQSHGSDPRDAGLETWDLLMNMIGRGEAAQECIGRFDDLMLKEWALKNLLSNEAGGGAGGRKRHPLGVSAMLKEDSSNRLQPRVNDVIIHKPSINPALARAADASRVDDVVPGTLLRASSSERSPFLLEEQEFHKSVVLVLGDDDNLTVGAILNRPATKALDVQVSPKDGSGIPHHSNLPIRFGGQYSLKDTEPLLWLHCNRKLRDRGVGWPVGFDKPIWKCTAEEVTTAVGQGLARPEDFLVVTGVTVWSKSGSGNIDEENLEPSQSILRKQQDGIQGEIRNGKFEVIADHHYDEVWDALTRQEVLTGTNLLKTLDVAEQAWQAGSPARQSSPYPPTSSGMSSLFGGSPNFARRSTDTMTNSYSERVFKSDVKVASLSDNALRSWVATFLLGAPTLGAD